MQRTITEIDHRQCLVFENNKTKKTQWVFYNVPQHFTQVVATLAVSLGPFAAGLGKGYTSPALADMQEFNMHRHQSSSTFTITDQQASWVASLSLLGAFLGGLYGGAAMQYGRKRVLTFISIPFSIVWLVTVFAKSVETIFITAFIAGFCCSIVSMVTQVYVSEISSADIRGFLSSIQKLSGHLGIFISFALGAYLDWRQLALLVSIAPMMLLITINFVPETPSFLVLKGNDEEALRSLRWLRGENNNVNVELEVIKYNIRGKGPNSSETEKCKRSAKCPKSISIEKHNMKKFLKNKRLIKPLIITCGLMLFLRFSGVNCFGFYAVRIFRQTFIYMNPHNGAIAIGLGQVLASMLSGLLIDVVGRVPLLIISSVLMSLALASFGSYIYYEQALKVIPIYDYGVDMSNSSKDWIPLTCVMVFTIAFSLGLSPISALFVGELFPLEYRCLGSSVATSFSYLCAFIAIKTFVDLQESLGLHGVFWFYACFACLGLLFIVLFVPETKGKDLEELDCKLLNTIIINR